MRVSDERLKALISEWEAVNQLDPGWPPRQTMLDLALDLRDCRAERDRWKAEALAARGYLAAPAGDYMREETYYALRRKNGEA